MEQTLPVEHSQLQDFIPRRLPRSFYALKEYSHSLSLLNWRIIGLYYILLFSNAGPAILRPINRNETLSI